jgi:hypothetical protein
MAVNSHCPEAAMSADANMRKTAMAIAVFMRRSSSVQNNFFLVANTRAVFSLCATLVMSIYVFMLKYVGDYDRIRIPALRGARGAR